MVTNDLTRTVKFRFAEVSEDVAETRLRATLATALSELAEITKPFFDKLGEMHCK
jgi:hypothetical protein